MEQITEEQVLNYLETCPLEDALSVIAIGQGILRMRQRHQPARRTRSDKGQPREPLQRKFLNAKTGQMEHLVADGEFSASDFVADTKPAINIVTEGYGGVVEVDRSGPSHAMPDWVQPKKKPVHDPS